MITMIRILADNQFIRFKNNKNVIFSIDVNNITGGLFLWKVPASTRRSEDVDQHNYLKVIGVDEI